MNNPEHQNHPESQSELVEAKPLEAKPGVDRGKKLETSTESSAEQQAGRAEAARIEAEAAFSREEASSEHKGREPAGSSRAIKRVSSEERQLAYKQTMAHIRTEMSAPAKAFSQFIHQRGVERASGILANSVARPNAVLSGSTCALVLVSSIYLITKLFGYPLSGFETIGAFMIGWVIGLTYDYMRAMIIGKSQ